MEIPPGTVETIERQIKTRQISVLSSLSVRTFSGESAKALSAMEYQWIQDPTWALCSNGSADAITGSRSITPPFVGNPTVQTRETGAILDVKPQLGGYWKDEPVCLSMTLSPEFVDLADATRKVEMLVPGKGRLVGEIPTFVKRSISTSIIIRHDVPLLLATMDGIKGDGSDDHDPTKMIVIIVTAPLPKTEEVRAKPR